MRRKCAGCGKEFNMAELTDAHWGHEKDCPNFDHVRLENYMIECDCDLWYHPQCCLDCKQRDIRESVQEGTKQLTRVIAFMKSLGGLYADIADDAQMELNKLIAANEELYEKQQENKK